MTKELSEAVSWWRQHRTFKDSEYVFLCEATVPALQERRGKPFLSRQRWLGGLCEKVGVKPFGIHAIRHLSASILDDLGYPITVIQALLRHKSANTTAKYLHKLRGMRVALDDAFKRKPPVDQATVNEQHARCGLKVIKRGKRINPTKSPTTKNKELTMSANSLF